MFYLLLASVQMTAPAPCPSAAVWREAVVEAGASEVPGAWTLELRADGDEVISEWAVLRDGELVGRTRHVAPLAECASLLEVVALDVSLAQLRIAPVTPEARLWTRVGLGARSGLEPSVAPTLRIGARWAGALASVDLGATLAPGLRQTDRDGAYTSRSFSTDFGGCFEGRWLRACGQTLVGWQRVSGDGFARDRSVDAWLWAVGARLETPVWRAADWRIDVGGSLWAPLTELRLRVGERSVWTTPPIAGGLHADFSWRQ